MPKLMHLAAGIAIGALGTMVMTGTPASLVAVVPLAQAPAISIEALQRTLDVNALPVHQVQDMN